MFFRDRTKSVAAEAQPRLNSDIRFALKHRNGMLTPHNIAGLFGRQGRLGFYMAMKASDGNPDVQADLLRRAADRNFDLARMTRGDAAGALGHLAAQDIPLVEGQKLAPIDSIGAESWAQRFTDVLTPVLKESPGATLYSVAYSTYVGLDKLAELSLQKKHTLGILHPSQFGQEGQIGFMLEPGSADIAVKPLAHDFERPADAVVFDDALYSGNVRSQVDRFWGQAGPPQFVAAFVDMSRKPN